MTLRLLTEQLAYVLAEERALEPEYIDPKNLDLRREYVKLNKLLFNGELGLYPMKWTRRKDIGGMAKAKHFRATGEVQITGIEISSFYEQTYQELLDTLAHEMIHISHYEQGRIKEGHGPLFRREMKRINSLGKGFNIVLRHERSEGVVRGNGKKKEYMVVVIADKRGDRSISVYKGDDANAVFAMVHGFPKGWREVYSVNFYLSSEPLLEKYPIKRKIAARSFGSYGISKKDLEKVLTSGKFYGAIKGDKAAKRHI